jgi:hypothetical protein
MKMKTIQFDIHYNGNYLRSETFCKSQIKIGKLKSSDIELSDPNVSRMHAVIDVSEKNLTLIDLGTSLGVHHNGVKVDRSSFLGTKGSIVIGPFEISYSVLSDLKGSVRDPAPVGELLERVGEIWTQETHQMKHHSGLLNSLLDEIQRLNPDPPSDLSHIHKMWSSLSDSRKREILRMLVASIRKIREEHSQLEEIRTSAKVESGDLLEVFKLTPQEALVQAENTLSLMAASKSAMEFLLSMKIEEASKEAFDASGDGHIAIRETLRGHHFLIERLKANIVKSSLLLTALLARAGGRELSEEETRQLDEALGIKLGLETRPGEAKSE